MRRAAGDGSNGGCSSAGRVPDCDSGCRGFESHQPPHSSLIVDLSKSSLADVTIAAPTGKIDHPNAQRLQEALTPILDEVSVKDGKLLLDFGRVEYISSMGLRVLMIAAKRMRSHDGRIAVAALQPAVAEIFEIARFKHVLEAFPTVRAALEALSPAALAAYNATTR